MWILENADNAENSDNTDDRTQYDNNNSIKIVKMCENLVTLTTI